MTTTVGQPISRVDGRRKVTGAAPYAAEFNRPRQAYGVIVDAAIAKGRISRLDTADAEAAPGVLAVISHRNAPRLAYEEHRAMVDPNFGERLHVFQDDRVVYNGQPIAVVVAETLEQASHAAGLVGAAYEEAADAVTAYPAALAAATLIQESEASKKRAPAVSQRGDVEAGLRDAAVRVDAQYWVPRNNHHPIELHATTAEWDGDRLTLWDKSQWVNNTAAEIGAVFGIDPQKVRVICPFVGGAFGSALRTWPHVTIAALAARVVDRPVKVMLTRRQMVFDVGARPATLQHVSLGATKDGRLTAIRHVATAETSTYEEYSEAVLSATRFLHACPSVETQYRVAWLDVNTPTPMRAPGEATGVFALECAMDELAVALGMDPVELRLRNEPVQDDFKNLPFSSRSTRECYRVAAEKFGWARRNPQPRSMRDGRLLVGWGMASATYPTNVMPAKAKASLLPDGTARVTSATSDMGPGTWTSMTQIAAEALGLPLDKVRFELGDTAFPQAPVHGGSMTMASVGSAVQQACHEAKRQALAASGQANAELGEVMRRLGRPVEAEAAFEPGDASGKVSTHAFGAVFAEVVVDPELGTTRVRRIVGAYGAGRIVNPKMTRSQSIGGMVGGIGMALFEKTERDAQTGRVSNGTIAEYLVPVCADAPFLDVTFVEEHDPHVNPLGVKGVGEIALVGVAAAIANAVHHATGRRVRDLPIMPEALL